MSALYGLNLIWCLNLKLKWTWTLSRWNELISRQFLVVGKLVLFVHNFVVLIKPNLNLFKRNERLKDYSISRSSFHHISLDGYESLVTFLCDKSLELKNFLHTKKYRKCLGLFCEFHSNYCVYNHIFWQPQCYCKGDINEQKYQWRK